MYTGAGYNTGRTGLGNDSGAGRGGMGNDSGAGRGGMGNGEGGQGLGDDNYTDDNSGYVDPFADPYAPTIDVSAPIPLAVTGMGPAPTPSLPPLVNYTSPLPTTGAVALTTAMFRNPDGSPTYDGAPYSPTDLLNPYNLTHLFGGFRTPANPSQPYTLTAGAAAVPGAATIGGLSSTTLALLVGAGLLAVLVLGKRS